MHLVAITRLASPVEAEAKALAADLGGLPYDQRLKLARGIPAIVLTTPDPARAVDLAERVRARGHAALAFASTDVVATHPIHHFVLDERGLGDAGERLAWGDVAALVRAGHNDVVWTSEVVSTSKFSPTRAIVTGGMMLKKTTSRQVSSHKETTQDVLYIYPRTGGAPWLLREQYASYATLGDAATGSSMHNFALAIDRMRTFARGAVYDDRLVARRASSSEIDLLAYVVAMGALASAASPFR